MIRLETTPGPRLRGLLTYSDDDQSFNFVIEASEVNALEARSGTTSLVMDTLQLETDAATGRVLYPWGLLPRGSWQSAELQLPPAEDGVCTAHLDGDELVPGVSERVSASDWVAEFDAAKGILRVSTSLGGVETLTRIADGVYVGVHVGELRELWLLPEYVD